jgi:CBS domain-containing protein
MDIAELASKPVVYCLPTNPIAQVARMMKEHDIGCVVVVDLEQRPVGVVTDRDLVVRGIGAERAGDDPIDDVMTHEPVTIAGRRDAIDAATHMAERECRRLPVVDDAGKLIGIVTLDDLLVRAGHTIDELSRVVSIERSGRAFRLSQL